MSLKKLHITEVLVMLLYADSLLVMVHFTHLHCVP